MFEEVGSEAQPRCLEGGHHASSASEGPRPSTSPPCSLVCTVEEFLSRLHLQTSQWPPRQTLSALQTLQSPFGTLLQQLCLGCCAGCQCFSSRVREDSR